MNVQEKVPPGSRMPESKSPSSAVTVCGRVSSFVQVTVLPVETVIDGG